MKGTRFITAVGIAFGAGAGWLYWHYYGCTHGCAITSKPLNSSVYGALMGGLSFNLIAGLFPSKKKSKSNDQSY